MVQNKARELIAAESTSDSDDNTSEDQQVETHADSQVCRFLKVFVKSKNTWATVSWFFGVGVLVYHEDFCPLEASYFITQIVTTIGYGDICVKDDWMKLFISFFILGMLVMVGFILNEVVSSAVAKEAERMKTNIARVESLADSVNASVGQTLSGPLEEIKREEEVVENKKNKSSGRSHSQHKLIFATGLFGLYIGAGTIFYSTMEACSCSYGATAVPDCTAENACKVGKVKTPLDAFYMSVVTLTTVGFGDYTPATPVGRLFGIPWMMTGIVAAGFFVTALQDVLMNDKTEKSRKDRTLEAVEKMTLDIFAKMDMDGSGGLCMSEWVSFMLVQEGLVEQDSLDRLSRIFNKLDRSKNGIISWEEVEYFQKKRVAAMM